MYGISTTRILNYLFRETLTRQIVRIYSNFNKHIGEQMMAVHFYSSLYPLLFTIMLQQVTNSVAVVMNHTLGSI